MLAPLLRLVALLCFRLFDEQMYEGEEGDQHDGDDVQHDIDEVLRNLVNMELIVRKSGDLFNIWAEPPIQPLLKVFHHHHHHHHHHQIISYQVNIKLILSTSITPQQLSHLFI